MLFGQSQKVSQIIRRSDSPLRIGGRTDIGQRHPVQHVRRQAAVVRQVAGRGSGGDIDRLGPHSQGGHGIDLIEGVRHQDDGFLAGLGFWAQGDGRVEQPLPCAVQDHQPILGHRHAIAPGDPARNGRQKLGRTVVWRVDAKAAKVRGQDRADEIRHGVARLADGHGDGVAAGGVRVEKFPQTRKRIVWQVRKPLRKRHCCLKVGVYVPHLGER